MGVNKDQVRDALDIFGEKVVGRAKSNLKGFRKGGSTLEKTLDWETEVSKNSWHFSIHAQDYWEYVDAGVKGIGGDHADIKDSKGRVIKRGEPYGPMKRVTNNKFSYKEGIANKPSRKHFDRWAIKKGKAPRGIKGKFTGRIGLTTAISHHVWHTGIESTYFLTDPFERYFKKLPDEVVEAFNLKMDDMLEFALKTK
jgi:hypothetical protein